MEGAMYWTVLVNAEHVAVQIPEPWNLLLQKFGFDPCKTPLPAVGTGPIVNTVSPGGQGVSAF